MREIPPRIKALSPPEMRIDDFSARSPSERSDFSLSISMRCLNVSRAVSGSWVIPLDRISSDVLHSLGAG